ncbi:hypothetical protein [Streptomyces sp. WAC06614]|uniref:hypothetical protein n=1 Tax=Streptomyces sp. WAC06614 TaxID=2487416 RepID=UPI000F7AA8C6|nr:hypothetical protein [Streptomyces sp. WAC06614]RSS82288.1 hypothetical protein EF918_07595 [Streptomyces sp. WAC06614]
MSRPEIEIFWPATLPTEPAVDGEDMLRRAGFEATCLLRPVRRGVEDVVLVLVTSVVLEPFLKTLFERLAEDAHEGLKAFVRRLLDRPAKDAPAPVGVVIEAGTTGARFQFTGDLPDKAYAQVVDINAGGDRWTWDANLALWTPA